MQTIQPSKVFVFSGSRWWSDFEPVKAAIGFISSHYGKDQVAIYHGAQRGLDVMVAIICKHADIYVKGISADFDTKGLEAGPKRNTELLLHQPVCVFAYPLPGSRGTTDMIRQTLERNIPIFIYEDGYFSATHKDRLEDAFTATIMRYKRC